MPKDKSGTYKRIIPAAKKEFMENGFEKASMRRIASESGISAAGLYRHFSNKEAMFDALLQPLFDHLTIESERHKRMDYDLLEANELDRMWLEQGDSNLFLDLLYTYYEEFKLLLCHAQGTRHENFIHDFVTMKDKETIDYLNEARRKGIPVNDILPKELHLLLSAYYTAVFEVIIHDFTREEAKHYFETLRRCFYPGFKDVLGL
jgi:AcrR family transcriptional regulator